jgi:hypothetical protein
VWLALLLASLAQIAQQAFDPALQEQTLRILHEARESAEQIQEPGSKAAALAEIAAQYQRVGEATTARQIFDGAFLLANSTPQRSSNRAGPPRQRVILSRARAGDFDGALRDAASIAEENSRDMAFATLAQSAAARGEFPQALEAAARVQLPARRDSAYREVAVQHLRFKQPEAAAQAAQRIANPAIRASLLAQIAGASNSEGYPAPSMDAMPQAIRHAEQIPADETSPGVAGYAQCFSLSARPSAQETALAEIAVQQARRREFTNAIKSLESVQTPELRESAFAQIAELQARSGDTQGARATAGQIARGGCRSMAFARIALMLFERGEQPAARLFLGEVGDDDARATTLIGFAGHLIRNKRFAEAAETLRGVAVGLYALPAARQAGLLATLARYMSSTGNRQEALAFLRRSYELARDAPEDLRTRGQWDGVRRMLLREQIALRDFAGAQETIQMLHSDVRPGELQRVAAAQSVAEGWLEAYAWASRLESPAERALALCGVAEGLLTRSKSGPKN